MGEEFTRQSITDLINDFTVALTDERTAMVELLEARAAYDTEKMRVAAEGYANETINGKNEAARKLQEAAIIEDSNGLYWLGLKVKAAELAADLAEIDRKSIEAEVNLTRAWLYSQASIVR